MLLLILFKVLGWTIVRLRIKTKRKQNSIPQRKITKETNKREIKTEGIKNEKGYDKRPLWPLFLLHTISNYSGNQKSHLLPFPDSLRMTLSPELHYSLNRLVFFYEYYDSSPLYFCLFCVPEMGNTDRTKNFFLVLYLLIKDLIRHLQCDFRTYGSTVPYNPFLVNYMDFFSSF